MDRFVDLRSQAADALQIPNPCARSHVERRQMTRSPQTADAFAPHIVAPPSK
jgi:hypothetical protein